MTQNKSAITVVFLATFLFGLFHVPTVSGQGVRLKKGDKIQVEFLGEWYDAEVTEIVRQGRMLKATFTDGSGKLREDRLFSDSKIRLIEQPTTPKIDVRKWTSADGEHSIIATYDGIDGDDVILKKEDGSTISVPLSSLCKTDNIYVDNLTKAIDEDVSENDAAKDSTAVRPGNAMSARNRVPESTEITLLEPDRSFIGESEKSFGAFNPADMRADMIKEMMTEFHQPENNSNIPTLDLNVDKSFRLFAESADAPKSADTPLDFSELYRNAKFQNVVYDRSGHHALACFRTGGGPKSKTILVQIDLANGKVIGQTTVQIGKSIVCDINSDGTMLLTRSDSGLTENQVDVWKLTDGQIAHFASWILPGGSINGTPIFAAFTADDKVLSFTRRGQIILWKLDPLKPVAQFTTGKHISAISNNAYQISRDRRHFYAAINGNLGNTKLIVIDLVAAECVGTSKHDDFHVSLAVSQSGERLAMLGKGVIQIFDQDMNLVDEFTAGFEGLRDQIRWLDDRFLVVRYENEVTLVDTQTRVPLWGYGVPSLMIAGVQGNLNIAGDGSLWVGNGIGQHASVQKFILPHESARQAIPADPEKALAFQPGMTVEINMQLSYTAEEKKVIRDHWVKQFESIGVKHVEQGGDLKMNITTSMGATRSTQYEVSGVGVKPGTTHTVNSQSRIFSCTVSDSAGILWKRIVEAGAIAPAVIIVREGQTVDSAANNNQGSPSFFTNMRFPKHVIRQPPKGALGFSKIDKGELVDLNQ